MAGRFKVSPFIKQCFVTTAVGLNTIGFGCSVGYPAILLPQLKDVHSEIPLSKEAESWIAAMPALSMVIGNIITLFIMDRLGRRMTHYTLTIIALMSWYITIFATSVWALIIARTFVGITGGILITLRSILIGEYTSPRNRGAFLTTVSLTQTFGIFFSHLLGSLLSWQKTALICAFFPFISLVMIMYTPESPSWLVSKGRYDECREVFRWLRGTHEDEELEDMIEARMAFEQAAIKENVSNNVWRKLTKIIRKKEFYKPIIIMINGNMLMQFSGGTTMAAFSTVIISLLMGPSANAHFWMVILDSQRIIWNALAVFVINRTKRRVMLLSTGVLSVVSHIGIAVYVYCRINGWDYDSLWLPVLLINLQYFAVAVGTVPVPQVIGGEVFPLEYRTIGGFISLTTGCGVMFVTLKTFPQLIDSTGLHGTYIVYGSIIVLNLIIMLALLPETKGKTLQQIEDELRGVRLRLGNIEEKQSLQSHFVNNNDRERKISERSSSLTAP